jgi:hypothetical protein
MNRIATDMRTTCAVQRANIMNIRCDGHRVRNNENTDLFSHTLSQAWRLFLDPTHCREHYSTSMNKYQYRFV